MVLCVLVGLIWWLAFRKSGMYEVRQAVPPDAVFVAETPSINSIHEKLYRNKIWTSLKEYPYFEACHKNLDLMDSLSNAHPILKRWLMDRPFAVSCHRLAKNDYDVLYVCDLGKLNVVQAFEGMLGKLLNEEQIQKRGELSYVMLDSLSFFYAIKANLLLVSFSESLILRSLTGCGRTFAPAVSRNGDITLEVDHDRFRKWMGDFLGEIFLGKQDTVALKTTALALELQDKALYFKGETQLNRNYFSLWSALNLVDGHASEVEEIVGNHVAAYLSLCFSSFEELQGILTDNYKISHFREYTEYERTLKRLNKYLGVDIAELLTSWIGHEIAVIKPAVDKEKRLDNLVLAVQAKDPDLARDQLSYLVEQIDRRTPVRFRDMEYNGHTIRFLSLKGFFHIFLGPLFKKWDTPYYTFIGDYVVFSNSASTLATMIKDYSLGNTLENDEKYHTLMKQLGTGNNVYAYISSPETYEYLFRSLTAGTKAEFTKNKGAFQSFESIGIVLRNAGSNYETRLIANYNSNASADYEIKEQNRELEDFADRVESGYYAIVIPDSIAVSTRGDYAYQDELWSYAGRLNNGDPDGVWTISDRQGRAVAQCVYREGKPHGDVRFFFPDGVVSAQVRYEQGQITSYQEFFQDGTLKAELEYNKGLRHGYARFYYSTGHLFAEGKYKKGKRSGTWKYYRVTGEVDRKMKF